MRNSDHKAIRSYLMRASSGEGNQGKKMYFNPHTRKFEVADVRDAPGSREGLAPITPEDMWSFAGGPA